MFLLGSIKKAKFKQKKKIVVKTCLFYCKSLKFCHFNGIFHMIETRTGYLLDFVL